MEEVLAFVVVDDLDRSTLVVAGIVPAVGRYSVRIESDQTNDER
jgi:hypothetical protein